MWGDARSMAQERAASMGITSSRRIAYVPQEPMSNLDPSFTIGSQLVRGLRAARQLAWRWAREFVFEDWWLKLLALLIAVLLLRPRGLLGDKL